VVLFAVLLPVTLEVALTTLVKLPTFKVLKTTVKLALSPGAKTSTYVNVKSDLVHLSLLV
jgi:hypothetical protein